MLDSNISSLELDVKIRRTFSSLFKKLEEEKNPQKASLVSDLASMKELPVGVIFLSSKFKMLISYLLILYYYPLDESLYCYLYLDLEDLLKENSSAYWLTVLLENREIFLKYLEVQETMTEQQFFSGICNTKNLSEAINQIQLRFEEKFHKPKRLIRRKGYRDKGSLGSVSSSALKQEMKNDFYLTLLQYQKEEEEILRSETCTLLREHLLEGRVLTDELLVDFKIKKGKNYEQTNHNSPAEDYCKQRSREEIIRKERKDRAAAERDRIQKIETGISATDSRIKTE